MSSWWTIRNIIVARDNETCQQCKAQNVAFDVHHIVSRQRGGSNDPSNLITLCRPCHRKAEKSGPDMEQETRGRDSLAALMTEQGKRGGWVNSGPKAGRPAMPGAGRPHKAALTLARLAELRSALTARAAQLQRADLWSMAELRGAQLALTALAGLFEDEQARRFQDAEDAEDAAEIRRQLASLIETA